MTFVRVRVEYQLPIARIYSLCLPIVFIELCMVSLDFENVDVYNSLGFYSKNSGPSQWYTRAAKYGFCLLHLIFFIVLLGWALL